MDNSAAHTWPAVQSEGETSDQSVSVSVSAAVHVDAIANRCWAAQS